MSSKSFIKLIENSDTFAGLKRQASENTLAHCVLFISQDQLHINLIAQMLARFVLGLDTQKLDEFNADIHLVGTADKMVASDIDSMLDGLLIKSSKGNKKIYLMPAFHTLRLDIQSKLLKTLEEPLFGTHFLLGALSEKSTPAPILSRARTIALNNFASVDIYNSLLDGATGSLDGIKLASEISGGTLTAVYNFLTDKNYSLSFNASLKTLKNALSSKEVLDSVLALSNFKDYTKSIFDYLELILRDTLMQHIGASHLIRLKSIKGDIEKLTQIFSIKAIENIILFINKSRRRREFNANFNSLIDELVFKIVEFKVKYQ